MSTSIVYHTQNVRGFQLSRIEYGGGCVTAHVSQKSDRRVCAACGSPDVTPVFFKYRLIRGLMMGLRVFVLSVAVHRLRCRNCGAFRREPLPFLPTEQARHTRALERFVVELRQHMSIAAIARVYHLDWKTIKNIEKRHLKRKYRRIRLKDVRHLALDEIHVGRKRYLTIAVDLDTGAVLHVIEGRDADCLREFARRLKLSGARLEAVATDMAGGYGRWVREHFPAAAHVYDHFHVIKLMNEKVDEVRRQAARDVSHAEGKLIKGKRWLLLRGEENLDEEACRELDRLKEANEPIATACILKEQLRWTYQECVDADQAAVELNEWCRIADESEIGPLRTMANTIRQHWQGILAYWDTRLTTGRLEGFNNKIRWLIRQAYGYRDDRYFFLKIFDLPQVSLVRQL